MSRPLKVLITGSEGFTGRSMYAHLSTKENLSLHRIARQKINHADYTSVNLENPSETLHYFSKNSFDQVYHFAGTYANNFEVDIRSNVNSTFHLIDAIIMNSPETRILLVGSASEYGEPLSNPVNESHPLGPLSPYGLSKQFQTNLMSYYVRLKKANIVMARTFNLFGKGMSADLFVGRLYSQIDLYKQGVIKNIELGNLDNKRDYIHIEHALDSYVKIMNKGITGEIYNVGSGSSIRIKDFLNIVLMEEGLDSSIIVSKLPLTPPKVDILDIYADIKKLKSLG